MSSSFHSDDSGRLPHAWLPQPWDPGTAGVISERSHLIDLIPLYRTQLIRYFLFWGIIVGLTLVLGIGVVPFLNSLKLPVPQLIKLEPGSFSTWLGTILLFLTAVISYLAYSVRRQKPNVSSKGRILLVTMLCFLYMSLDKTADCEKSIAECIAFFSGDSIEGISLLFWQTVVYGAILLCLVSQILFEFSGTIVSQTVIFCGAIFYAIASGCCFIPAESWKIPIPVIQVVTGAILLGDFCFFWAMLNYTRFVLLDGFGLLDSGWSIAMNDYKRQMRKRPLKSSGYSAGLLEEETEQKATDEIILPEKSESDNLENGLDSSRINLLPPELTEKQPPITTLESPIYTTETLSTSTPVYGSGVSQYSINSITAPVQSAPVQSVPIQSAPIQSVPVSSTGAPISSSRTVPPKPAAPAVPPVSAAPTPLEVQQEFIRVEAQIKRKLTHEEKKSVIRRMLKQRKNSV